jgi:hypothetical protein
LGASEYFEDSWNRLDFVIVLESVVSGILVLVLNSSGSSINTSTLRLLRLLRPLRTLRFIPVRFIPARAPVSPSVRVTLFLSSFVLRRA